MPEDQLLQMAALPNAVPYGNKNGRLMLVCDTDGAKALAVPELENGTAILDVYVMAQAAVSEPKSSGQHLIKYMLNCICFFIVYPSTQIFWLFTYKFRIVFTSF